MISLFIRESECFGNNSLSMPLFVITTHSHLTKFSKEGVLSASLPISQKYKMRYCPAGKLCAEILLNKRVRISLPYNSKAARARISKQIGGVLLQRRQIFEWVDLGESGGVNEAHK